MIITFCIILLIILLLLFIPVEIIFNVRRYDCFDNKVDAGFLFGLFRLRLYPKPKKEKQKKIKEIKEKQGVKFRKYSKLLQNGPFLKKILSFIQNTLNILRFEISKLHLRLGLDDPADTGNLWSILGPVSAILGSRLTEDIIVEPDFSEPRIDLDIEGRMSVKPVKLIYVSLLFLLSPTTIKSVWSLRN